MMTLVSYDVSTIDNKGKSRLRKVAKECQNYGQRVQNSVFECVLDEKTYVTLKHQIEQIIDEKNDSVRFYIMGNNWQHKVISIGKTTSFNMEDDLII